MPASNRMPLVRRVLNRWMQAENPGENHWTIGRYDWSLVSWISYFYEILARKYDRTYDRTHDRYYLICVYNVVSCLFNFKQMRNLPATSFLENKRYGLQAREHGFPKLCPTLSESRYRAISWACNKASNLGVRLYTTVTQIMLTGCRVRIY